MTPGLFIGFTAPGFTEGLFILVVILLLFGVKDAPRMARKVADLFQQLRFMANEFRNEFMYRTCVRKRMRAQKILKRC